MGAASCRAKPAEFASGAGAIVLGVGLALMLPGGFARSLGHCSWEGLSFTASA